MFSDVGISKIISPISLKEIKEVVVSLPKDSASGPDGFHASFCQKHCKMVRYDLLKMVTSTWKIEKILWEFNETNVVLIQKFDHPQIFKDFRPISLSNVRPTRFCQM